MQKVALTDLNAWDVAWPAAAGLGLGVGARLLRHGVDLKTKKGVRAPKETSPLESAQIEVPVEVSDAEANELAAQGIKVGAARAVLPAAKATDSTTMPSRTGVTMTPAATPVKPGTTAAAAAPKVAAEGLASTVIQGALGAGAAYGGWSVLDNVLDKQRLEKAKGSLQRSRDRIKRLIAGEPDPSEAGIAGALKTAEEAYLKLASLGTTIGGAAIGGVTDLLAPIGIPLGIGAAMLGAKAYNETRSNNKYRQRVKQIAGSLEHEDPMAPVAVLHPVRKRSKNAPSEAGVVHNPGAEPTASPEIDVKVAAHRGDDDEESDYGKWVALAIAGAAGVAGIMWVRSNPDVAIQYAPWAKDIINDYIRPGKPVPPDAQAKAKQVAGQAGATPQDVQAGQQTARDPQAPGVVQVATTAVQTGQPPAAAGAPSPAATPEPGKAPLAESPAPKLPAAPEPTAAPAPSPPPPMTPPPLLARPVEPPTPAPPMAPTPAPALPTPPGA